MKWEVTAFVLAAVLGLCCGYFMLKMRQMQAMMKKETRALGRLHDLNNMLAGVSGAAELLAAELKETSLRKYVNVILCSCRNFSSTCEYISGKQPLFSLVNANECVEAVCDVLLYATSGNILVKKNIEENDCLIYGNRAEIENALLNLGLNAVDATGGSGTIEIFLRKAFLSQEVLSSCRLPVSPGNYSEIVVKDYGGGIPETLIDKIFTPFYSNKKCMSGSGLGLFNVQETIKAHRGTLKVETSNEGTSFFIYLPLADAVRQTAVSEEVFPDLKAKILLVDDDRVWAKLITEMLRKCGAEVVSVSSVRQALDVYDAHFDVVLSDVILPEKNGFDFLNELRRINPQVKMLLMSGCDLDERQHSFVAKDDKVSFIRKPCAMRECVSKISNMLAK